MEQNFILVKNGLVVNVIVATQDFINEYIASQYDYCIVRTDDMCVGPGYTYDGTNFYPPVND